MESPLKTCPERPLYLWCCPNTLSRRESELSSVGSLLIRRPIYMAILDFKLRNLLQVKTHFSIDQIIFTKFEQTCRPCDIYHEWRA